MTENRWWWDVASFEDVVRLAVTELYQDSVDTEVAEEGLSALPRVVAETLRNTHFFAIREQRDEAREGLRQALLYLRTEHDANTDETDPRCLVCAFLDRYEALLAGDS